MALPAGVHAASKRYLDPVFSSVRRDANLQYGTATLPDGSRQKLKLDLYRPVGDKARNRPAVIFVHGGDYTIDKALWRNRLVGKNFARRGFVAAAINYRTGKSGTDPEAAYDLRAAVRWFRKNAGWLNVSPNRIVVMGTSAGATAAMTATFKPEDAGTSGNPGYSSRVAAGVALSGTATDFTAIGPGDPPIGMIIARDDTAFYAGTQATCNFTRVMGNICELYEYESGGHPPDFWTAHYASIMEDISRFICLRVLGPTVCRA